jgi:hypothetical protein
LDGAHHIIFDSLNIIGKANNTFEYAWGVGLVRDADSNIIRKCNISVTNDSTTVQNTYGIIITGTDDDPDNNGLNHCDGNIITHNTITGGNTGIFLDNFDGNHGTPITTVTGNQFTYNTITNYISNGIGVLWSDNTLIANNEIGFPTGGGSAIYINEYSSKMLIKNNRIHNFGNTVFTSGARNGITIADVAAGVGNDNNIVNNLIYNFNTPGAQTGINVSGSASYLNIYHNTVVMDSKIAGNSSTVYGISVIGKDTGVNVLNNISMMASTSTGSKYATYTDAAVPNATFNNNDLYAVTGYVGRFNGGNYTTITQWQVASGVDYHSLSANPVFADTASGDFTPTAQVIDNMGKYVNVDDDITGKPRSNTHPDIGAYEFLSSPCNVPPIAGTASALPGYLLCSGTAITINTLGNSGGIGQTYQWQTSPTLNGTYANFGSAMVVPSFDTIAYTTQYYRLKVACATDVAYTTPIYIKANKDLPAANYTINKALPTSDINFNSFADMVATFKCGIAAPIVINVVPGSGPYNEQVIIPSIVGSSTTNTLTIHGNGETINFAATNTNERAVIKLNGASNVSIDSLTLNATGTSYGFGVQLLNNADNNVIRSCKINVNTTSTSQSNFAGIVVSASATGFTSTGTTGLCDNNQFIGNTISGGYYCVTIVGNTVATSTIDNNKVVNNKILDFYSSAIYVSGTTNTLIEGNDISRPTRTIVTTPFTIYITGLSTGLKVSKNRIHNLFDAGTAIAGSTYGVYTSSCMGTAAAPNVYSNNAIYNIKGTITAENGFYNSASPYALYYNNTVSLDDSLGTSTISTTRGFSQTGTSTGIEFRNNIVTIKRTTTGLNHGIYISGALPTGFAANNNDYFVNGSTATNNIGYLTSASYSTIATWQAATKKETGSLNLDPVYKAPTTGDLAFTLAALDNMGTPISTITTDINGTKRDATTPDVGAFETTITLPVKLVSISATKIATNVLVDWATASEINSLNYQVERSTDGVNFTLVGTVKAQGNSNGVSQYNFTDAGVTSLGSTVLYYRLKMVDIDGKFEYSKIVSVNLGVTNGTEITVSVFPNPYVNELYAKITTSSTGSATVQLKDGIGRMVSGVTKQSVSQGTNIIRIDGVDQLPRGIYFVEIEVNGTKYTSKIFK